MILFIKFLTKILCTVALIFWILCSPYDYKCLHFCLLDIMNCLPIYCFSMVYVKWLISPGFFSFHILWQLYMFLTMLSKTSYCCVYLMCPLVIIISLFVCLLHSFIKCFILVRVGMDLQPIPGTLVVRQEHRLAVYCRPSTDTFTHAF